MSIKLIGTLNLSFIIVYHTVKSLFYTTTNKLHHTLVKYSETQSLTSAIYTSLLIKHCNSSPVFYQQVTTSITWKKNHTQRLNYLILK